MINDYGFAPANELTLKSFVEQQAASGRKNDPPGIEPSGMYFSMVSLLAQHAVTNCFRSILPSDSVYDIDNFFSHSYIGDIDSGRERRYEQYAQYAQPQDDFSARPFRPEAVEEFKEALQMTWMGFGSLRSPLI
jgi:hypothetical protein